MTVVLYIYVGKFLFPPKRKVQGACLHEAFMHIVNIFSELPSLNGNPVL